VALGSARRGSARERIGFREAALAQAREPDRERRSALEAARRSAVEDALNPLAEQTLRRRHALARELGWPSYRDLCEQIMGVDLAALGRQAEAFLRHGEARYAETVDPAARRVVGVGLDELRRSDLPWLFGQGRPDGRFPTGGLVAALSQTLAGLGIDLAAQKSIVLDIARRPRKSPRAFCAAVRIPQEVYLVVAPAGGREDYVATMHEGGHAQHFAGTDPDLPFELRQLGDHAVSEAFAFLFDHLVDDPRWLRRRLGARDSDGALAELARAQRLMYQRRYAAKLTYELELHGAALDGRNMSGLYARRLSGAVGVSWPAETWLTDVDPGLYVANYLRAWALEAHLRRSLRERFGVEWFERPAAGRFLAVLWREGQRLSAEEMLARIEPGASLDFARLATDEAA
jgi:hypothetical protein